MNKVNGSNLDVICWWGKCAEKCRGQKASNESSVKDNARLCNIIMILHVEKPEFFYFEREKKMGDLDEKNSLMVGNYESKEKKTFAKRKKRQQHDTDVHPSIISANYREVIINTFCLLLLRC